MTEYWYSTPRGLSGLSRPTQTNSSRYKFRLSECALLSDKETRTVRDVANPARSAPSSRPSRSAVWVSVFRCNSASRVKFSIAGRAHYLIESDAVSPHFFSKLKDGLFPLFLPNATELRVQGCLFNEKFLVFWHRINGQLNTTGLGLQLHQRAPH